MVIIFLDIVGKAVMWSLLKQLFCIFPQAMRTHCQEKGKGKTCSCSGLGDFAPWNGQGLEWEFWRDTSLRSKDKRGVQMELLQTRESGILCQIPCEQKV